MEDVARAPVGLLTEFTRTVTSNKRNSSKSLVKSLIIGHVPDRGGRVNEELRISNNEYNVGNVNKSVYKHNSKAYSKKK